MILAIHSLLATVINLKIKNFLIAILLSFFSHYLLDFLPHWEYSIQPLRFKNKNQRQVILNIFKICLDLSVGCTLALLFSPPTLSLFLIIFFSLLPDALNILSSFLPLSILKWHTTFHTQKVHYFKYKKVPLFYKFLFPFLIISFCLYFLLF